MQFASACATIGQLEGEWGRLLDETSARLGTPPDLVLVFFSSHFEDDGETIVAEVHRRWPAAIVAGCSAEGVIGGSVEYERRPAVSVMLASLPGATIEPFHIPAADITEMDGADGLRERIGIDPQSHPAFLVLGDPFSVPVNPVLQWFDAAYPGGPVIGGMASGCERPGQAALLTGGSVQREGLTGLALRGVHVESVVSQGCRPVGRPLVITKGERNIIRGLGGKPALERLQEIVEQLPPGDSALAQQALFVGRAISEYRETFGRGDFLIRHLMGYDPASGALGVSDEIRVGATIQFQVRDADSADEDMRQLLAPHSGTNAPAGLLLFSCNGRGTRMWSQPNHDVATVQQVCGEVPVAGFFAAGEIGPIGGRTFIHGHTASMALIRPAPPASSPQSRE